MNIGRLSVIRGGAAFRDLAFGSRRGACGALLAAALAVPGSVAAIGLLAGTASADVCSNAAVRFGPSANLPDCRAYELVTPRFKGDNSTLSEIHGFADGQHVFYSSLLPLPGSQNGQEQMVLSSRTPGGWVTASLTTPSGPGKPYGFGQPNALQLLKEDHAVSFASDFSAAFVNSPLQYGSLDQNEQWDTFRVDLPSGAVSIESLPDSGPMTEALIDPANVDSTVTLPPENYTPGAFIAGNSADGSRVFFETTAQLPMAPGTPADAHTSGNELYERHGGHTYLVGVLPDGSVPACGAEVGLLGVTSLNEGNNFWGTLGYNWSDYGAVSADGTNVVFHSPSRWSGCWSNAPVPEKNYLRVDNGQPDARTVELPEGMFLARTADQQKILVLGGAGVLEYDIASGQATPVGVGSVGAEFSGLIASSADGSRVYSSPGRYSGENLAFYEDGVLKQTPIPAAGVTGWMLPFAGAGDEPVATPDGSRLVFVDRENLTSYDSRGHHEVYVYDATNGSIVCVSCDPDGSSPLRNSGLLAWERPEGDQFVSQVEGLADPSNAFTQDSYPAISNDHAHVFFDSREGLVPQDTNGLEDVYEWEQAGTGTCGTSNTSYSTVSGGCVYLISPGTGSNGSWITGASEDGRDVFFVSNDSLAPQVAESAQEIYDARVGGGFPYTSPVYGCDSGQCQGPQTPAPPLLAPPPSATFVGVGNPAWETSAEGKKPARHKKHPRKHRGKGRRSSKRGKRRGRK